MPCPAESVRIGLIVYCYIHNEGNFYKLHVLTADLLN